MSCRKELGEVLSGSGADKKQFPYQWGLWIEMDKNGGPVSVSS